MRIILIAFFLSALLFSCKKESSTQPTHSSGTVTSTLTVDDTAVANISHSSFNNGGKYAVVAYGANGNPEVQITFWDAQPPGTGQFLVTTSATTFGKCNFSFSNNSGTSTASSGVVNISYSSGTTYIASFSNINVAGGAGSHKVAASFTF